MGHVEPGSAQAATLGRIWQTRPGWIGWLGSVDHKEIGKRYLVTAFLFLLMHGHFPLPARYSRTLTAEWPTAFTAARSSGSVQPRLWVHELISCGVGADRKLSHF